LAEVFKDVRTMVEDQQPALDQIEDNVDRAAAATKQAEEELHIAAGHACNARWKCLCIVITTLIIVAIVIAVIVVLVVVLTQ